MTRPYQSLLLGMVALLLLRLSITDEFLTYVKPVMRPWLMLSAVVLLGVAIAMVLLRRRAATIQQVADTEASFGTAGDHGHGHGDGDDHGPPRLAWILVLPIAAVFIVAPEPLGIYAASRQAAYAPQAPTESSGWPPRMRSAIDGAHEMGLNEFNMRAFFDESQDLADRRLRLTGFVRHAEAAAPGEMLLTRFVVSCCAADGQPVSVRLHGVEGPLPAEETWLTVEGTWLPNAYDLDWSAGGDDSTWAELHVEQVTQVPQPREPYEDS